MKHARTRRATLVIVQLVYIFLSLSCYAWKVNKIISYSQDCPNVILCVLRFCMQAQRCYPLKKWV